MGSIVYVKVLLSLKILNMLFTCTESLNQH